MRAEPMRKERNGLVQTILKIGRENIRRQKGFVTMKVLNLIIVVIFILLFFFV
jgi:hypothetical protein